MKAINCNNPKAAEVMLQTKTAMLLHYPFFASIMMDQLEVLVGKFPQLNIDRAGTDGKRVWFDEDWLACVTLAEAVFTICHEIAHCMWLHMDRGRMYEDRGFEGNKFIPQLYNKAADYVINDMLVVSNIGKMPANCLHDPNRFNHTMLVDDVYRELYKQAKGEGKGRGRGGQPGNGQPGDGDGSGDDPGQQGGTGNEFDTHVFTPAQISQAEMHRAVQSALEAAKAMGKLPAGLERFVNGLVDPQVPWQEILRHQLVKTICADGTTWARPHRKRLALHRIYLPAKTGFGAGDIIIGIDTSGSIGQRELTAFLTEVQAIIDDARPETITLIFCDAAVYEDKGIVVLTPDDSLLDAIKGHVTGGGGTDFRPVFDWVEREGGQPAALVYLTDMYGTFPSVAPPYPVFWCSTTESAKAPFGTTLYTDLSKYAEAA